MFRASKRPPIGFVKVIVAVPLPTRSVLKNGGVGSEKRVMAARLTVMVNGAVKIRWSGETSLLEKVGPLKLKVVPNVVDDGYTVPPSVLPELPDETQLTHTLLKLSVTGWSTEQGLQRF